MLIINGLIADTAWVPLFYALMPYKDEALYCKVFEMVNEALGESFSWPENLPVMMDFETAERNAWLIVNPGHTLEGCMFHMNGGQWMYVHKNGKSTLYNSNTDKGKIFKGIVLMTDALPLVPLNRIDEALNL